MSMHIVPYTGLSMPTTTMQPSTSSRLPGVPVLDLNASGPEYSRWRRSVKFALETKDTWKYCNGALPMPMPKTSSHDTQPSLLEERRAWVRQDREVKLDIFLSLTEEVMQDVFEVGPPLPPSNYTSQQILEALDDRFENVKFEAYHHAFCHFLNLHIDQFTSVEDFNKEFMAVLEDLLDYGHPLSNTQACSAYFSKLRCTQNPWVAKKLAEWDAQPSEPQIYDLMQDSPPWSFIRPLTTKSTQSCFARSIPEELSKDTTTGLGDSDVAPELSYSSTVSSKASHSRQTSSTATKWQNMTVNSPTKPQFDPNALRAALERLPTGLASEFMRAEAGTLPMTECATPEWLNAREDVTAETAAKEVDTAPPTASHKPDSTSHTRSVSLPSTTLTLPHPIPRPHTADPTTTPEARKRASTYPPTFTAPSLSLHPAFRSKPWPPASPPGPGPAPAQTQTQQPTLLEKDKHQLTVEIHPALRPMTPNPQPAVPARNPSRPRPRSLENRGQRRNAGLPPYSAPLVHARDVGMGMGVVQEGGSGEGSEMSLPLQGTEGEEWDYGYEYGEWCRREGENEEEDGNERQEEGEGVKEENGNQQDGQGEAEEKEEDVGTIIPPSHPSTSSSASSSRTTTSTTTTNTTSSSSSSSTAPSTRTVHFPPTLHSHHSNPSLSTIHSLSLSPTPITALPAMPTRKKPIYTYPFSSYPYSPSPSPSFSTSSPSPSPRKCKSKAKNKRSTSLSRTKGYTARRLSLTPGGGSGDSMAEFIDEMREKAIEGERRRARAWSLVRFGGAGRV